MHSFKLWLAATVVAAMASPAFAQPIAIDGDDITLRGCVAPPSAAPAAAPGMLVWSRAGMLTAGTAVADALNPLRPEDMAGRVLYWVDDDDLSRHIGQMVEIEGDLESFETGEVEIDHDDGFTEIKLKLDGDTETIRVPTAWLQPAVARAGDDPDDVEFDIVARRVDVDEIRVLGRCTP